ncbi:glycosyltransferase [Actinomycetospora straminea]|uniref:glycosyltransferase n=1 Tax=Actinomycetospora straminea TaxID=663607 RepID=UPI0023655297|nr:glycosyltransferase [Actinomycetospora straminea]MDD7936181.1 glycosyltransferase [Actinomycetospora straminea]
MPDLRSSVVEEMPATQALLFTSRRADADPALLADPRVSPFTPCRLVAALRDPELAVLEVAEPLWTGEWVRALRWIALAKLLRPRITVATYAIENLDARARLAPRALAHRPVLGAVVTRLAVVAMGVSLLLGLDAVVFGTSGAAENYRRAFGWALRRTRQTVLTPRLSACSVCGPRVEDVTREPTVLFLGTPSERKGFAVLTAAWERAGASERGWRLVVADPSGATDRAVPAGVSIVADPPRATVHALLRTAAVVAMPSVRRPGWREQIGLPLVEGLTHGCRVVTTTETGLADDLRDHPRVVLTTPGDVADLAAGLRRAMDADDRPAPPGPRGATKSDVVAWWLDPLDTSADRR